MGVIKEQNPVEVLRLEIEKREKAHRKAQIEASELSLERERVHTEFGVRLDKKREEVHRLAVGLSKAQEAKGRVSDGIPTETREAVGRLEIHERVEAMKVRALQHTLDEKEDDLKRVGKITFDASTLFQFQGPVAEAEAELSKAVAGHKAVEAKLAAARVALKAAYEARSKEAREELAGLGL